MIQETDDGRLRDFELFAREQADKCAVRTMTAGFAVFRIAAHTRGRRGRLAPIVEKAATAVTIIRHVE